MMTGDFNEESLLLLTFKHHLRRIPSRRAHDASAGMRGRAAHVEIADRRAVARPPRRGPQEEELFERQLPLEDVPLRQAPLTLEIERRHDLPGQDAGADARRGLRNR